MKKNGRLEKENSILFIFIPLSVADGYDILKKLLQKL